MAHASLPRPRRQPTPTVVPWWHGPPEGGRPGTPASSSWRLEPWSVVDRRTMVTPWLPRRAGAALATSAMLHLAALAAFGWVGANQATWHLAVDAGQAVSLLVVAAAPEEGTAHEHPMRVIVEQADPEPHRATEAAPLAVHVPRPAAEAAERLRLPAEVTADLPRTEDWCRPPRPPVPDDRPAPEPLDRPVTPPPRAAPRMPAMPAATLVPVSLPGSGQDPGATLDVPASKLPANPAPEYPLAARQRHEEGRVLLLVHLDAEGRVLNVELRLSSGSSLLDQAARDAVRQWRFSPAHSRGVPVTSQLLVPVRFSLREAG